MTIIFESILTTFEASVVFEAALELIKIGLEPKTKPPQPSYNKLVQIFETHTV